MTPIPTRYAGYHFRSRLEARWAVFFDALRLDWAYEPEGFLLPNGATYLPDFFVRMRPDHPMRNRYPGAGYWIEVKGETPTSEETENLRLVSEGSKHHAYFLQGMPGDVRPIFVKLKPRTDEQIAAQKRFDDILPPPQLHPIEWLYHSVLNDCCAPVRLDAEPFVEAMMTARSARFEHGHSGAS